VGRRLDRYFVQVSQQFERMEGKVEGLREELGSSRAEIVRLREVAQSVDARVQQTHDTVVADRARAADQGRKVADIISAIAEFDRDRINCSKCKDRIRLKGDGREQLLAFHTELIQQIQLLQTDGVID
jgi:hypothetical protein